ncbi:MAG: ATP-binding protein [Clostridia bacterium]|nr:ATP-binding protein [Clostridia bacterium]
MSGSIHNLIKNEYEKRQRLVYENLVSRKEEVYSKIPRVQEIDDQIHIIGIKYNKMILFQNAPADAVVSELSLKINELRQEKDILLINHGYSPDYLEASYSCSECKDTGYKEASIGFEKCTCYKQQLINLLYKHSNIKLADLENFSTFDDSYYPNTIDEKKYGFKLSPRENILRIKERCLSFVENFHSPEEKNLFFSGRTGVGKTFISNCIAIELLNRGRTVLYQTASTLFESINEHKKNLYKEDNLDSPIYKNILEADLLIIDDLGTESPSAARYAELLTIINTRSANNLVKPCKTIISTNISVKMLHQYYDERIVSRIIGCFDMFAFIGEDIRSIKKMNKRPS